MQPVISYMSRAVGVRTGADSKAPTQRRSSLGAAILLGLVASACEGGGTVPDDGAGADAEIQRVTLGGTVRNRADGTLNIDATASVLEHPDLSMHVDNSGSFSLRVPRSVMLTVSLSVDEQPLTVQQPVALAGDVLETGFSVIDSDEYNALAALAPHSDDSAIFLITVLTMNGCDVTGARLRTVPESGTVIYADEDQEPVLSYTEIQPNAPGGYIVGVSGTVQPTIYDLPASCAQVAFPVTANPITFMGDIAAQPGAFHHVYVFVR